MVSKLKKVAHFWLPERKSPVRSYHSVQDQDSGSKVFHDYGVSKSTPYHAVTSSINDKHHDTTRKNKHENRKKEPKKRSILYAVYSSIRKKINPKTKTKNTEGCAENSPFLENSTQLQKPTREWANTNPTKTSTTTEPERPIKTATNSAHHEGGFSLNNHFEQGYDSTEDSYSSNVRDQRNEDVEANTNPTQTSSTTEPERPIETATNSAHPEGGFSLNNHFEQGDDSTEDSYSSNVRNQRNENVEANTNPTQTSSTTEPERPIETATNSAHPEGGFSLNNHFEQGDDSTEDSYSSNVRNQRNENVEDMFGCTKTYCPVTTPAPSAIIKQNLLNSALSKNEASCFSSVSIFKDIIRLLISGLEAGNTIKEVHICTGTRGFINLLLQLENENREYHYTSPLEFARFFRLLIFGLTTKSSPIAVLLVRNVKVMGENQRDNVEEDCVQHQIKNGDQGDNVLICSSTTSSNVEFSQTTEPYIYNSRHTYPWTWIMQKVEHVVKVLKSGWNGWSHMDDEAEISDHGGNVKEEVQQGQTNYVDQGVNIEEESTQNQINDGAKVPTDSMTNSNAKRTTETTEPEQNRTDIKSPIHTFPLTSLIKGVTNLVGVPAVVCKSIWKGWSHIDQALSPSRNDETASSTSNDICGVPLIHTDTETTWIPMHTFPLKVATEFFQTIWKGWCYTSKVDEDLGVNNSNNHNINNENKIPEMKTSVKDNRDILSNHIGYNRKYKHIFPLTWMTHIFVHIWGAILKEWSNTDVERLSKNKEYCNCIVTQTGDGGYNDSIFKKINCAGRDNQALGPLGIKQTLVLILANDFFQTLRKYATYLFYGQHGTYETQNKVPHLFKTNENHQRNKHRYTNKITCSPVVLIFGVSLLMSSCCAANVVSPEPVEVSFDPLYGVENGIQYFYCHFQETYTHTFHILQWKIDNELIFSQRADIGYTEPSYFDRINETIDSHLERKPVSKGGRGQHWIRINTNLCDEKEYHCTVTYSQNHFEMHDGKELKFNGKKSLPEPVEVSFEPSIGSKNDIQYFYCDFQETHNHILDSIEWSTEEGEVVFSQYAENGITSKSFKYRIHDNIDSHLERQETCKGGKGRHWIRINDTNLCDEKDYHCSVTYVQNKLKMDDAKHLIVQDGAKMPGPVKVSYEPTYGDESDIQYFYCDFQETHTHTFDSLQWFTEEGELIFTQFAYNGITAEPFKHRIDERADSHLDRQEICKGGRGHQWIRVNKTNLCDEMKYRCMVTYAQNNINMDDERKLFFQDTPQKCHIRIGGDLLDSDSDSCILVEHHFETNKPDLIVEASANHLRYKPTFILNITESSGLSIYTEELNSFVTNDETTCTKGRHITASVTLSTETEYEVKLGPYCHSCFTLKMKDHRWTTLQITVTSLLSVCIVFVFVVTGLFHCKLKNINKLRY